MNEILKYKCLNYIKKLTFIYELNQNKYKVN